VSRPGYRRKRLRYRCNGSVDLEAHTQHWVGFTWQAGPWQVIQEGPWGEIQVWASSEAEGRRVISHVHAIAGWPAQAIAEGQFKVRTTSDTRVGKPGTCHVRMIPDGWAVTTREGPSGPSDFVGLIPEP
jgi:hypothetical protein